MCFDHIVEEHVLGLTFNKSNPLPPTHKNTYRDKLSYLHLEICGAQGFLRLAKWGFAAPSFPGNRIIIKKYVDVFHMAFLAFLIFVSNFST